MLVGHFGIAEIGKASRRDLSFGWLLLAAYFPDVIRALAVPFTDQIDMASHSLPSVLLLAMAIGGAWMLRGGSLSAAGVLAATCLLHWPADVFTGCKPTIPDGPWIGFVHYRRPVSDIAVEGALLVFGWWCARRSGLAIRGTWLVLLCALQLCFLGSMYRNAEFLIGNREWTWHPSVSLVPAPHVLETVSCREPDDR